MQTKRLTTSFEGLNSSLVQLPGKLWSCEDLSNMGNKGKIHLAVEMLIAVLNHSMPNHPKVFHFLTILLLISFKYGMKVGHEVHNF